jgi:long-chain acyl-CoA synthetase
MAEFVMLSMGCTLCFADPKSLSATGAYPIGALEQYSPTLMVAVPKIWDTIKKGLLAKVALGSPVIQFLVKTAFEWRSFALKNGFDTPLFKALVFKKIKAGVGGKLRYALSGGGPLNEEVQDFIRTAFGVEFVQGYVSCNCFLERVFDCSQSCCCYIAGAHGNLRRYLHPSSR